MHRSITLMGCAVVILLGAALHGLAQVTIRAAAADPVPGWERMQSAEGDRIVWVAPTPGLTSADIQRAQPMIDPDGRRAVTIVFTDAGAKKMRELSAAQITKPIALLLDGKLIWAPVVRSEISTEASITGGPNGLTPEQVERIVASVNRKSLR